MSSDFEDKFYLSKILLEAHSQQVEQAVSNSKSASHSLDSQLLTYLSARGRECEEKLNEVAEILPTMVSGAQSRIQWTARLTMLHEECERLRGMLQSLEIKKRKNDRIIRSREAFRLSEQDKKVLEDSYGPESELLSEYDSLVHTQKEVQSMTSESIAVLNALKSQREGILHSQDRLSKLSASSSFSTQLLRNIMSTIHLDRIFLYFGMIIITLLLLFIYMRT